ncbi:cdc42 effector protein 3 [Rhinatrema bivittatum]|uniref:cdc42 effector protein 3 n=1 Tax=Rhinatrema bivittatum TaxID=194408 RepID=UPI00112E7D32|nr:cdc42 effector protein 3 [Rhinatrema bivittatum]XP_029449665.1 cdc42 effector protein 3 [Rhinatrema bivittatum]XP_029449666.1 cdc42 effector protein 3 [Rhinatrema bivittatum]XP_029449667.1 cdc42 effector protein 3 [Rhinatrema bivittatum]XP_029449668.1 cdc42 effector protein 3 [Rhinatrema bivittatum]
MPAKTPIYLKAGNNKKGKKFKLRDILSPDMISPPLGDFRHTIHIGKEGQHDVFGDMSFLQGNFELLPGNQGKQRVGLYGGHTEFLRANSTSDSMFSETPSPVLKNAISLPAIGGSQALMLPLLSPVTFNSKQDSFGPSKIPRLSCEPVIEEQVQEKCKQFENGNQYNEDTIWKPNDSTSCCTNGRASHSSSLSEQYSDWQTVDLFEDSHLPCELTKTETKSEESLSDITGSLLSLQLDLGPSLLDEVLNVMEKKTL